MKFKICDAVFKFDSNYLFVTSNFELIHKLLIKKITIKQKNGQNAIRNMNYELSFLTQTITCIKNNVRYEFLRGGHVDCNI